MESILPPSGGSELTYKPQLATQVQQRKSRNKLSIEVKGQWIVEIKKCNVGILFVVRFIFCLETAESKSNNNNNNNNNTNTNKRAEILKSGKNDHLSVKIMRRLEQDKMVENGQWSNVRCFLKALFA